MSKNIDQVFIANPITSNAGTDLMYFGQSPYGAGNDAAMTFTNFSNQFVLSTAVVNGAHGGTGVNNGTSTMTIGGNFTMTGAFTFSGTLTGATAVTFPTSGTLATTSQLFTSPLTTKGDLFTWSTTNDRLPVAVGDGKVLQVSSGAATGLAYSTPTYPSASGTARKILVSDGTNNVYSTETYAVPGPSGNVMTSDGTNWTSAAPAVTAANIQNQAFTSAVSSGTANVLAITLTPAPAAYADGQLFIVRANATNSGSATLNVNGLGAKTIYIVDDSVGPDTLIGGEIIGGATFLFQYNGALNSFYLLNPALIPLAYLQQGTTAGTVMRSNGTRWTKSTATFADTYTASNLLYSNGANTVTGLATANNGVLVTDGSGVPSISSTLPALTTSSITFNPTTGGIVGTTTNDNAAAGKVGEYVESIVAIASSVSVSTATSKTITSISLTAGDWDVSGEVGPNGASTTTITTITGGISTTLDTLPGPPSTSGSYARITATSATSWTIGSNLLPYLDLRPCRLSLSGTTTVYLVGRMDFGTSTASMYGMIRARRIR